MTKELYRVSPAYRALADRLFRVEQQLGALEAAYCNAIGDQNRIKAELHKLGGEWHDDPGQGGSGG